MSGRFVHGTFGPGAKKERVRTRDKKHTEIPS